MQEVCFGAQLARTHDILHAGLLSGILRTHKILGSARDSVFFCCCSGVEGPEFAEKHGLLALFGSTKG